LLHALVSLGLVVGQLGIAGGATPAASAHEDDKNDEDGGRRDAALLLRDQATAVLVPALRSNRTATQELGSALLQAALVPRDGGGGSGGVGGWSPEQSALLEGLLPLLEEGVDAVAVGLASLAAALVAAEPRGDGGGGGGLMRVLQMCGATAAPARLNALRVLGEVSALRATSTRHTPKP
jgi:hypothetical protein